MSALCAGGGILIIPHAVVKSGVILGPITVGLMVYLCDAAKDFLLGALARGEELYSLGFAAAAKRRRRKVIEAHKNHTRSSSGTMSPRKKRRRNQRQPLLAPVTPTAPAGSGAALEAAGAAPERYSDSDSEGPDGPLYLHKHVLEVTELTKLLFGNTARYAYLVVMGLWTLGTMWSFGSVFGASLANHIPILFMPEPHNQTCDMNADPENCRLQYIFYVLVFGCVVVPLTLMDMTEQVMVQVIMAAGRIVLVCIMSGTVLAAWTCDGVAFKLMARASADGGLQRDPPPLFDTPIDFSGLSILIPVAVTAAAFHQAIPSITRDTADKWDMHKVLRAAFIIVGVCYVVFGVLLALFFGEHIEPQSTLLWADYVGCADVSAVHSSAGLNATEPFDTAAGGRILLMSGSDAVSAARALKPSGWAQFVTLFVLLFPAADVASAFPLNAIALANNLLSLKFDLQAPKKDKDAELNALLAGGGVLPVENADSPALDLTSNAVGRDVSVPTVDASGSELAINKPPPTDAEVAIMPVADDDPAAVKKEHPLAHIPKWARVTAKLMAALPPIVGACLVSDLDKIQQVNGSLAVFLVYTAPPLLWMGSRGALVLASASTEPEDEEKGFKGTGPVGSLISLQDWMVTQWWRYVPAMVARSRPEERSPLMAKGVQGASKTQRYTPLDAAAPMDEKAESGMLSMQMGRTESSAGVVGGDTPVMPGGPTVGPGAAHRMDGDEGDRSCFGGTLRMLIAGTLGHRGFGIYVTGGVAHGAPPSTGSRRGSGGTLDSDSGGDDGPTVTRTASASSADGVSLVEAEEAARTVYEPVCMQATAGACASRWCALAPGAMAGGSLVLWTAVVILVISGWFQ